MAFKGDFDIVLVVTSTKFTFVRPMTNISQVVSSPFLKMCRPEAARGFARSGPNNCETENAPKQIVCSVTKRSHLIRNRRRLCFRRRRSEHVKEQCRLEIDDNELSFGDDFLGDLQAPTKQIDSKPTFIAPLSTSSTTFTPRPAITAKGVCVGGGRVTSKTSQRNGACPGQALPRHKRPSHINAEYRRRNKIQKGFDTLKEFVPSLSEESSSSKESKCAMLRKTSNHIRGMNSDLVSRKDEIAALRKEIDDLHSEIEGFQAQLPSSGITAVEKPICHIETMYTNYLKSKTKENWTFWLFSFVMRPLFESYNRMVSTGTPSSFIQSVKEWAQEHLSLVNLRPCVLSALRQICLKSSILNDSKKLPEEAVQNVMEYCNTHSK